MRLWGVTGSSSTGGWAMDGKVVGYKSPKHVQVLFLMKSRNKLREKYQELKRDQKRQENRVRDVGKSREQWRGKAEALEARVAELELQKGILEELVAIKKRVDFLNGGE